jgi:hypothetical protein
MNKVTTLYFERTIKIFIKKILLYYTKVKHIVENYFSVKKVRKSFS